MAVRRESVRVDLTGNFIPQSARVAGSAALLRREIDSLSGSSVRTSRSTQMLDSDLARLTRTTEQGGASIDRYSGRLSLIAQLIATIGPAAVPIGAVAVPTIAGLAAVLGTVAIAGGSAVVAFQGVGEAVKAVQDYNLDPTAASLEKAQEAMAKLGPDARRFVREFQEFRPVLTDIRDAAAAGWFPGLTESLDDFERVAPKIEALFQAVGTAGGESIAAGAESLASSRWTGFFDFLTDEVPGMFTDLSVIVGDITHGMAEMWMSFQPGNDDFIGWLGDVADGFDNWASSNEGREDIAAFLDYARENGPAVADFFSSLVDATSQIVQAAAPLGGPTLAALTAVMEAIANIADSDMGTPLLAAAAAMSIFNRAMAASTAIQTRAAAGGSFSSAIMARTNAVSAATQAVRRDMSTMAATYATAGARTTREQERMATSAASLRGNLAGLAGAAGRVGAPIAGLGLMMSGTGDKFAATNTATLALMGAMAGPGGAAAGGLVGALLDIKKASGIAEEALQGIDDVMAGTDPTAITEKLEALRTELNSTTEKAGQGLGFSIAGGALGGLGGLLGDQYADQARQISAGADQLSAAESGLEAFAVAMGATYKSTINASTGVESFALDSAELNDILTRSGPALAALGYDATRIAQLDSGGIRIMADEVREWTAAADSSAGRTQALSDAVGALDNDMINTADSAAALRSSLDAAFGPQMNLSAATDAWRNSLRDLNEDLAENRTLTQRNDAGDQNRAAIRDRVQGLTDVLVAQAEVDEGGEKVARTFARQREALMKSGIAARLSAKELRAYLRELEFTPERVETIVEANVKEARANTQQMRRLYDTLPTDLQADIRANGIPKTKADVRDLVRQYELTEKERSAVMRMRDLARRDAIALANFLDQVTRTRTATVNANTGQAQGVLGGLLNTLNSIQSKTITVGIHTVRTYSGAGRSTAGGPQAADGGLWDGGVRRFADGGWGEDGRYYERKPQMIRGGANILWGEQETGWEAYISGKPGMRDRNLTILSEAARRLGAGVIDVNARNKATAYADGGGRGKGGGGDFGWLGGSVEMFTVNLSGSLKQLKKRLDESSDSLKKERDQRKQLMDAQKSFQAEVAGSFSGELFGNGLAGFDTALAANTNDTKAADAALRAAEKKGLDGALFDLLAESGDLQTLQQFSQLSRKEIERRERQYGASQAAGRRLGAFAGEERFGAALDRQSNVIDKLERTVRALRREVREGAREGSKQGSRDGTREGNRERDRNTANRAKVGR